MAMHRECREDVGFDRPAQPGHPSMSEYSVVPAVKEGELSLKYQPKIDLDTGHIFGVEALGRWRHPARGLLGPDEFIPQAERAGTVDQIDTWVIHEACRQVRLWQQSGEFSGSVAVNVSALELSQPHFADVVCSALERHGVDPGFLILEITESCAIDHLELALTNLNHLSGLGVRVSLDDFGTGNSNLTSLKYLPVSEVKVDRCFIKDIAHSALDAAIVAAIIAVAKAKGARVIAEGVETARQLEVLANMGCRAVQGYLIGPPMEPEDLVRAVRELEKVVAPYDACVAQGGASLWWR